MSFFDGIIGHDTILQVMEKALKKPAHGYLFCGPRGVGKTTVAERMAAGLLGGDVSRITYHVSQLASHSDFVRVTREEGAREIVVKQIRELMGRMQLTAARGGYKIALIEQADRLNEEAANALLKMVEEPSPKTVYLFVAEQPDRLPATLRSRLVKIEFGRVPTKMITDWLKSQGETKEYERMAIEARGCPGAASLMAFGEEEVWYKEVEWEPFIDTLLHDSLGKKLAVIEKIAQMVESQDDVDGAWREALEQCMRVLDGRFVAHPVPSLVLSKGLSQAWRLIGSAISPRLALEYALVPEGAKQGRKRPRVLEFR